MPVGMFGKSSQTDCGYILTNFRNVNKFKDLF